eukprot:gene1144-1713_t
MALLEEGTSLAEVANADVDAAFTERLEDSGLAVKADEGEATVFDVPPPPPAPKPPPPQPPPVPSAPFLQAVVEVELTKSEGEELTAEEVNATISLFADVANLTAQEAASAQLVYTIKHRVLLGDILRWTYSDTTAFSVIAANLTKAESVDAVNVNTATQVNVSADDAFANQTFPSELAMEVSYAVAMTEAAAAYNGSQALIAALVDGSMLDDLREGGINATWLEDAALASEEGGSATVTATLSIILDADGLDRAELEAKVNETTTIIVDSLDGTGLEVTTTVEALANPPLPPSIPSSPPPPVPNSPTLLDDVADEADSPIDEMLLIIVMGCGTTLLVGTLAGLYWRTKQQHSAAIAKERLRGYLPDEVRRRIKKLVEEGWNPPDAEVTARLHEALELVSPNEWKLEGVLGNPATQQVRTCVIKAYSRLVRAAALKVVVAEPGETFDKKERAALEREAAAIRRIRSPHVVGCQGINFSQDNTLCWLTMELVDGESLQSILGREGFLREERAVRVAIQVLIGLEAVHSQRMIHRDIKPANIMVLDDPQHPEKMTVKIVDFGIAALDTKGMSEADVAKEATIMVTQTHFKKQAGTPHYMAVEQWKGTSEMDLRVDIYAMGLAMRGAVGIAARAALQMLTGKFPYGNTKREPAGVLLELTRMTSAPDLRDLAPEGAILSTPVAEAVSKALLKDHESRWGSARDMIRALEKCLIMKGSATFHVYLSYDPKDEWFVTQLHQALVSRSVADTTGSAAQVFYGKESVSSDTKWEHVFFDSIAHSLVMVPVMSINSTAPLTKKDLADKRRPQKVLTEWVAATALKDAPNSHLRSVFPVFLGKPKTDNPLSEELHRTDFFVDGSNGGGTGTWLCIGAEMGDGVFGTRREVPFCTRESNSKDLVDSPIDETIRSLCAHQGFQCHIHGGHGTASQSTGQGGNMVEKCATEIIKAVNVALGLTLNVASEPTQDETQSRMKSGDDEDGEDDFSTSRDKNGDNKINVNALKGSSGDLVMQSLQAALDKQALSYDQGSAPSPGGSSATGDLPTSPNEESSLLGPSLTSSTWPKNLFQDAQMSFVLGLKPPEKRLEKKSKVRNRLVNGHRFLRRVSLAIILDHNQC